jgi:hypothetical protein
MFVKYREYSAAARLKKSADPLQTLLPWANLVPAMVALRA